MFIYEEHFKANIIFPVSVYLEIRVDPPPYRFNPNISPRLVNCALSVFPRPKSRAQSPAPKVLDIQG